VVNSSRGAKQVMALLGECVGLLGKLATADDDYRAQTSKQAYSTVHTKPWGGDFGPPCRLQGCSATSISLHRRQGH
jgi:hypothetical protein